VKEIEKLNRPPMSPDMARKFIEHEASNLRYSHLMTWHSYEEHKKVLNDILNAEPKKPKLFGLTKWKAEHNKWSADRDKLAAQIVAALQLMGVNPNARDAEKEAEYSHERYKNLAFEEALRRNPDSAQIIQADDERREQEEQAKLEAEGARIREENENYRRFRTAIRDLAEKFGQQALIITNAFGDKTYHGLLLGTVERNNRDYAVQLIDEGRVILHNVEKDDLRNIAAQVGKTVEIRSVEGKFATIAERMEQFERNRGWRR
jgi:hypothetical protein